MSRLYKAIAAAETIHALKHLEIMNGISSTLDNLKEAAAGEHYEFTDMYKGFIVEAEQEEQQKARLPSPHGQRSRKKRIMRCISKPCGRWNSLKDYPAERVCALHGLRLCSPRLKRPRINSTYMRRTGQPV